MNHKCLICSSLLVIVISITFTALPPGVQAQDAPTATFFSCDAKLAFNHPDGWFVQEEPFEWQISSNVSEPSIEIIDVIRLANQEAVLETGNLTAEAQRIEIQARPSLILNGHRLSPVEILSGTRSSADNRIWGSAIELTIQDRPAARVDFVYREQDHEVVGFEVIMALPDNYDLWLTAETTSLFYKELEATALALLDTVTFALYGPDLPPPGWSTYFEPNCTFRFIYPGDWIADSYFNRRLVFNSPEARKTYFGRRILVPSELEIEIIPPGEISDYFYLEFDPTQATSTEVLSAYVERKGFSLIDEPAVTTIGDYEVLRGEIPDGVILVFDFGDDQYAIFAARSGWDGFVDFEDQVMRIAESIQYNQSET